jgi:hypothetical protein
MGGLQDRASWDTDRARWQTISNELLVPDAAVQKVAPVPVPVQARIAWERDGIEVVDTVVIGWTSREVLVQLLDPRRRTHGVWVSAGDVRRR